MKENKEVDKEQNKEGKGRTIERKGGVKKK
jgi:hypothetical protein